MAGSFKEAYKNALVAKGKAAEAKEAHEAVHGSRDVAVAKNKNRATLHVGSTRGKEGVPTEQVRPNRASGNFHDASQSGAQAAPDKTVRQAPVGQALKAGEVRDAGQPVRVAALGKKPKPKQAKHPKEKAHNDPHLEHHRSQLSISDGARFALSFESAPDIPVLPRIEAAGVKTQVCDAAPRDDRELTLGIDFGTSNVKVIIGDHALGQSFAVPFVGLPGIDQYLLPAHLYQSKLSGVFSLSGTRGDIRHRDLKLSFLAQPEIELNQQHLIAFLALVIRRARGWLLTKHSSVYAQSRLYWRLAVGFPAAHYQKKETHLQLFERLCWMSWAVANTGDPIGRESIKNALASPRPPESPANEVEIAVVPEIAAQIYGFVVSNSFDRDADNIYLMADVGAGTLDASLFKVSAARGGKWDFEFYTSIVEPHGVMNLHRERVGWWVEELTKSSAPAQLVKAIERTRLVTDQRSFLPESFRDYFMGIRVRLKDPDSDPDQVFFSKRVMAQVQGKAYWRAAKDGLLQKGALRAVPFFLCGGGARLKFYRSLKKKLVHIHGFSWLTTTARSLVLPADLLAGGSSNEDYDRLSVAYGLSRLRVNRIDKAPPRFEFANDFTSDPAWRSNYIDKDMC